MSAQDWIYGLSIYFLMTGIIVGLFSAAGAFTSSPVNSPAFLEVTNRVNSNETIGTNTQTSVKFSNVMRDVFSFFVFNISISDGSMLSDYLIIIRLILVWLPLFFLLLAIYYSLPFTSGGG